MAAKKEVTPEEVSALSSELKECAKHLRSLLNSPSSAKATVAKATGKSSPHFAPVEAAIVEIEKLAEDMTEKGKALATQEGSNKMAQKK
jgi:hypothetical protein